MSTRNSAINWFEIPVRDMDRAQAFYERMLGKSLRRELMGSSCMLAVIPYDQPGVGGALTPYAAQILAAEGAGSLAGLLISAAGLLTFAGVMLARPSNETA